MYLRITRARFDPARADEVVPAASQVTAASRGLPGYQAIYQGIDRTAGTVAVASVWDTEEHARFSRDDLGEVIGRLRALGVQMEAPENLEIIG